jgi:hypothetical protein
MNDATANSPALELAEPKRSKGWTPARWLAVIALVFTTHVALIFLFGAKKEIVPRAVTNVPTLTLANDSGELLALNDPTLFALPHQRDFASAVWLKMPAVKQPLFRWTEPPRWMPLAADGLGATFRQFMQTNFFASQPLDFKPVAELNIPTLPGEPAPAQNSTIQIEGELAQRQLPVEISLTNWPYADVLAPCVVQVLVDAAGDVVSAVLLPTENNLEAASHYDAADQRALEIARALRFTPSSRLTFGRIIFNWHTVPPANE